jgi:hypothetical protein
MYCAKCQTDVADCTCPGIDESLKAAGKSPYIAMKWCSTCDKHYARCKCENPTFYILTGTNKEEDNVL